VSEETRQNIFSINQRNALLFGFVQALSEIGQKNDVKRLVPRKVCSARIAAELQNICWRTDC